MGNKNCKGPPKNGSYNYEHKHKLKNQQIMPHRNVKSWVYILRCADGSYYTGCTTNLDERMDQHHRGVYDGYTSRRRPLKLLWTEEFRDINEAIDAERQIKGWSRKKKEALMRDDFKLLHELAQSKEMRERRAPTTSLTLRSG